VPLAVKIPKFYDDSKIAGTPNHTIPPVTLSSIINARGGLKIRGPKALALVLASVVVMAVMWATTSESTGQLKEPTPTYPTPSPDRQGKLNEPDEVITAILYIDRCLAKKIDQYPSRIRGWIDKINEAKSVQVLKKVQTINHKLHESRHKNANERRQVLIDHTSPVAGQMQKLLSKMTAGPSLDNAANLVVNVQMLLNDDRREQHNRYQRKAMDQCHQFNRFVLENTITRDSILMEQFNAAEIASIDSSLLGVKARRIYEIAVGFMDSKLKERTRANFLVELTEAKKWPLSDF